MQKYLIAGSALVVACGSGAGSDLADHRGGSVYDESVRTLQFEDRDEGGTHLALPSDAVCNPYVRSYTVRVADHQLAWQDCDRAADPEDGRAYTPHVGARALSDAEWSTLEPTHTALAVSPGGPKRFADVGILRLTVATDDGAREYRGDVVTCSPGQCIVNDALVDAMQAARALAGK